MKHPVKHLDLVIIRSCQLACEGCCTFSDHDRVKGTVRLEDAEEWLKFWGERINPERVNLFGGEPLMHPQVVDWYLAARRTWPRSGHVWVNTNGYYLDKLFDHIDTCFVNPTGVNMALSVTKHSDIEPYSSLVVANYAKIKDMIIDAYEIKWPGQGWYWKTNISWDADYKKFSILSRPNSDDHYVILNLTAQHDSMFVPHYSGYGKTLKPIWPYDHPDAKNQNHSMCHIKTYVQLYKGDAYKCPVRATVGDTLEKYNLTNDPDWAPYYNKYKTVGINSLDNEIDTWFTKQREPENTCNQCGFYLTKDKLDLMLPEQGHLPKSNFKIKSLQKLD